ncbi:MAG: hypothetical protein NZM44_02570 [Candidatus Calescibacterium sp.]|nr:hypothetical protein [Candidatus Calescibacterium sp.]
MMDFNTNKNAPIFQPSTQIPQTNITPKEKISSDPFEKLINKSLEKKEEQNQITSSEITLDKNLENYKKQIEELDLEQLRIERRRIVDLIVKYMNEGKTELLDEAQKKYKIAVQVSDSKVMNFSASAIATTNTPPVAQTNQQEDFLKKLQESEILPPDNSPPPTIPQQTSISQQNNVINTTENQISSANPNVQIFSMPTTNPQGAFNTTTSIPPNQVSLINTLNTMNPNQINNLFSNPQGIFSSLNTLSNQQTQTHNFNFPINPLQSVHPYSPLMTSYGAYAPNLRKDPTMNAFLNGELYPTDMAELGVWSVLNRELFKKTED